MLRRFFFKVVFVAIAVCALLGLSGVLLAQGRGEIGLDRAIEVQERNTERLMAIEGVVGTAVGLNPAGRLSVAVLLERPGIGGIPQELEGVPVHPVVTGEFYALPKPEGKPGGGGVDRTARFPRPVPIGVSTGHPDITAGTISCRVKDASGNVYYALSNNHVYANQNQANIGDAVIQPGTYDGALSPGDDVGTLAAFEPIVFSTSANNVIDAAIASTTTSLVGNATPSDGYGTPKSTTAAAALNQKVKKYGRTTGLTKGQVYALNATVNVGYDFGIARFVHQIIITPGSFSAGGDSGSLIVVDDSRGKTVGPHDGEPVGLLFAGSSLYTVANPIDAVLDRFGVTVDGN
jgi:hypothetical protein